MISGEKIIKFLGKIYEKLPQKKLWKWIELQKKKSEKIEELCGAVKYKWMAFLTREIEEKIIEFENKNMIESHKTRKRLNFL